MRRLNEEVVFLDANVVMYAVGGEHPYRLPCQQVMSAIANNTLTAAIDTEIVQEILHRCGALRQIPFAKGCGRRRCKPCGAIGVCRYSDSFWVHFL